MIHACSMFIWSLKGEKKLGWGFKGPVIGNKPFLDVTGRITKILPLTTLGPRSNILRDLMNCAE